MAFDLALTELTDLSISAARDLAALVDEDAIINQRIKTRLKIERGSWVLDDTGTLGSLISAYFGNPMDKFIDRVPDVIRQALEEMDEIQIENVTLSQSGPWQVLAEIVWSPLPELDLIAASEVDEFATSVVVTIGVTPEDVGMGGGT